MVPLATRVLIQELLEEGYTQSECAELAEVSLRSVKRIAQETITAADDEEELWLRGVGRPSVTEPFAPLVEKLLRRNPDLRTSEILTAARRRGYRGGKSAMYELVWSLRDE